MVIYEMIYMQQKIGEVALDYFNAQSDSDYRLEEGRLNSYLNSMENTDWIDIDTKSNILLNKLTDNTFTRNIMGGITNYLNANAALTFIQNYDSICSRTCNGQVEISLFTRQGKVYLESIKIENPIYGGNKIEDLMIMNEVNTNFLFNPTLFVDTLPGRIFTGDNLLRYTSEYMIPIKMKLRLNDKERSAISGYVMPLNCDNDSFIYDNTKLANREAYTISFNLLDSTFNWFTIT